MLILEIVAIIIVFILFGCLILGLQMFIYDLATRDMSDEERERFDQELNNQIVMSDFNKNNHL